MIDFHTHILPNMDDGSDSVETSLKLLEMLEKENVKLVCLTSHFYPFNESIEEYIKRRNNSFNELDYQGNLTLKLGAEIRYYRGISISEDIDKLCLTGTKILLIEFPYFVRITESMIDEIISLKLKGYDVVLAHIERYRINRKSIDHLRNFGIKFQVNTDSVRNFFLRKKVINLIKNGYIYYLGSDCHNLYDRKPNYETALKMLKKYLKYEDLTFLIKGLYNIYDE